MKILLNMCYQCSIVLFAPNNFIQDTCKTLYNLHYFNRHINIRIIRDQSCRFTIFLYCNSQFNSLFNFIPFDPSNDNSSFIKHFRTSRRGERVIGRTGEGERLTTHEGVKWRLGEWTKLTTSQLAYYLL